MKSLNFDNLERDGLIRRLPVDGIKVRDSYALAQRDIKTSKSLLDEVLRLGLFHCLQRHPTGCKGTDVFRGLQTLTARPSTYLVIRFIEVAMGRDATGTIVAFDRMRRKRHRAVYDTAGTVSASEAENAIKRVEDFLKVVETRLKDAGFLE